MLRSHKRRFRPIGATRPEELGLSRTRARELRLAHAWSTVAGAALAARAKVAIRRGVLEVEACDETWQAALLPLMPTLAARMQRALPERSLRGWRARAIAAAAGDVHPIRAADDPNLQNA